MGTEVVPESPCINPNTFFNHSVPVLFFLGRSDPVFGSDQNHIMLISETAVENWPRMLKTELADKLADRIAREFGT